jgi:diguanylate cyclase (GGDEF)-like protein
MSGPEDAVERIDRSQPSRVAWSTLQLSEFLEVFEVLEPEHLLRVALDRVAEAFDAEVVALVVDGVIERCLGFPVDRVPVTVLSPLANERHGRAELPNLGTMHSVSAEIGRQGARLVVMRAGAPFERDEEVLLHAMGRALCLAQTAAASLGAEREARADSERREEENLRLVGQLGEKQRVSSRLQQIQRGITQRVDLRRILDAIVEGASELLGVEVVGLRVQGLDSGDHLASTVGFGQSSGQAFCELPLDQGFSGRAFVENRLVVSEHYQHEPLQCAGDLPRHLHAAMVVPVHRNGVPVGVLSVGAAEPGRRFSATDCETLEALAEHASLAVNDDSVVQRLQRALEGATHEAHHDALTGLLNRRSAVQALEHRLARTAELGQTFCLFIDIDHFKLINDMYGHAFGDRVLVAVGERLHNAVRAEDVVARLAGDEFVVVVSQMDDGDVAAWARRLLARLAEPMVIDGREVRLSASVGISSGHSDCSGEELIVDADVALYRAKQQGRSRVLTYDHAMRAEMLRRTELERELAAAASASEFVVHFQPLVDLPTMTVAGFESLVRWEHPRRGLLYPVDFLDAAEECGAMPDIDAFVLDASCAQLAEWLPQHPELTASVNLSARQFVHPGLVDLVAGALDAHGVPGHRLLLELTENVMMDDTDPAMENLAALHRLGVRFVVDDFGTGYSSLVYLKRFPVDVLKIDRSFVGGLGRSRDDETIVRVILRLADALGHAVVVEGVETVEQLEIVTSMGFTTAQGFLFSPALPAAEFRDLLEDPQRTAAWGPAGRDGARRSSPSR